MDPHEHGAADPVTAGGPDVDRQAVLGLVEVGPLELRAGLLGGDRPERPGVARPVHAAGGTGAAKRAAVA